MQLYDGAGAVEASLGLRSNGPALSLRNRAENAVAILSILGDDPELHLEDGRGNTARMGGMVVDPAQSEARGAPSAAVLLLMDKEKGKRWQAKP